LGLDSSRVRVEMGAFWGRLPARLQALFKLCNPINGLWYRLYLVEVLEAANKGIVDSSHGLLKASLYSLRKLWMVDIRSVLGMAHSMPLEQNEWLVNT